jgi:ABC-type uncharacterized transport system fused permease/ATPase subunit
MSALLEYADDSCAILEDYRATITELRGNLERLKELVEEQILLETPPCLRHRKPSHSRHSSLSSRSE